MTKLFRVLVGMAMVSVRAGMAQNPPAPPTPPPAPAPARPAPTTQSPQIDSHWLSIDSAGKTATFQLTAGLTGLNSALNFNGFKDGGLTFTVPVNWNVVILFTNHDGMLPHSAEVIDTVKPMPAGPVDPAFPRAETVRVAQGLGPEEKDTIRFTANKAGSYLIFCGVPGHGLTGMWIRFRVSATDKQPTLTATTSH
ncbi:MAG TPA: sulfocyanin-like copper-binding protein [Gemmatimonadales bacterium]|nr:sulfocyanin-like copper-binding protein [Gemmatimonadales bacterium]